MEKFTSEQIINIRKRIVVEAKKLIGISFSHGGITHSGLDCKGCCWLAYIKSGLSFIPSSDGKTYPPDWYLFVEDNRYLDGLLKYFDWTNKPQTGDLALFSTSRRKDIINHAGILIGSNKFIHARSGHKVSTDNLNHIHWEKRFKGYLILKEFNVE